MCSFLNTRIIRPRWVEAVLAPFLVFPFATLRWGTVFLVEKSNPDAARWPKNELICSLLAPCAVPASCPGWACPWFESVGRGECLCLEDVEPLVTVSNSPSTFRLIQIWSFGLMSQSHSQIFHSSSPNLHCSKSELIIVVLLRAKSLTSSICIEYYT